MENSTKYPAFRWFVLATVAIGYTGIGMMLIGFAPILDIIAEEFQITVGQISLLAMGIYTIVNAVSVIASGPLIDRFGLKPTLLAASLITVAGALLTPALSHTIRGIVIIRVAVGIGGGPISACVSAVAARWFPPNERGILSGFVGAGVSLGVALGLVLTGAGLSTFDGDWRAALLLLGIGPVIGLIMVVIFVIFGKEPRHDPEVQVCKPDLETESDFLLAVKSSSFYVCVLCMFAICWMMNAFNELTPVYIAMPPPTGLGFGAASAGMNMTVVQVGMVVGAVLSGFFIDRVFNGRTRPVIITGFVMAGACMVSVKFQCITGSPVFFIIALFLAGFFEAFVIPGVTTFIATKYPFTITGRIFSLAFGISIFGASAGVFVGGTVLHFTNSFNIPIAILGVVAMAGLTVALFLNPPKAFCAVEGDAALHESGRQEPV